MRLAESRAAASPRGGPQSFANAHSRPPQAAARTTAAAEDKFHPQSPSANGRQTQKNVCDANPRLTARWHDAAYCSPQNCAGRSLPQRRPAVVRECSLAVPAGCAPKTLNFILPFLASAIRASSIALGLTKWFPLTTPAVLQNRAVRRRPHAADCQSIPTAVGEQHIPTNCAASRLAQSSPARSRTISVQKKTARTRRAVSPQKT